MVDISETVHEFARLAGLTEEEAAPWSAWCLSAQAELAARLRGGVSWQEEHTRLAAAAAALACYRYRLAEQTIDPFQSFSAGDVVIHPTFGEGTVLSARPLGNDILLEVAFEGAGTKKLMSKFARLQKA